MKAKMQITISNDVLEALQSEADERGITPAVFARILLHERYKKIDTKSKFYTFCTRNWRELEAYVLVRNLGSVESFIPYAVDLAISRNRLSAKQKNEFEELLADTEKFFPHACGKPYRGE